MGSSEVTGEVKEGGVMVEEEGGGIGKEGNDGTGETKHYQQLPTAQIRDE